MNSTHHLVDTPVLNVALAGAAGVVWLALYGLHLWSDPAFRRWAALQAAQLRRPRPAARRGSSGLPPSARVRPLFPPANRPPPMSNQAVTRGAVARALEPAPPAEPVIRIAEWTSRHLPLRYRLLGRPRRAANDN